MILKKLSGGNLSVYYINLYTQNISPFVRGWGRQKTSWWKKEGLHSPTKGKRKVRQNKGQWGHGGEKETGHWARGEIRTPGAITNNLSYWAFLSRGVNSHCWWLAASWTSACDLQPGPPTILLFSSLKWQTWSVESITMMECGLRSVLPSHVTREKPGRMRASKAGRSLDTGFFKGWMKL